MDDINFTLTYNIKINGEILTSKIYATVTEDGIFATMSTPDQSRLPVRTNEHKLQYAFIKKNRNNKWGVNAEIVINNKKYCFTLFHGSSFEETKEYMKGYNAWVEFMDSKGFDRYMFYNLPYDNEKFIKDRESGTIFKDWVFNYNMEQD